MPAALVGTLLLTGCSDGGKITEDAAGGACAPSGAASDSVEVDGEFGGELSLTSETPQQATEIERTELIDGSGEALADGEGLNASVNYFNGSDGELVQHIPASLITNVQDQLLPWAYEAVRCAAPEQRVALVAPVTEVLGVPVEESGIEGIADDDSFIIVMDFSEADAELETDPQAGEPGTLEPGELLERAEGEEQDAPAGLPEVELDGDGAPTITMPEDADAPEELQVATLIEGDGEEVQPGDRVYVNYRGVIWRTGEEFDSSWSRGAPTDFVTTQVIGGFTEALEGQKVGSQIISVVPSEDGGYGAEGLEQMGHEPDDVMVFVLDILGTVHAD